VGELGLEREKIGAQRERGMVVPIDGNLHRVADDLPQLLCSAAVRMAWLHGGKVLQRESGEVGENEQQRMAREGQSRFISSG
jgi:hypothetical protein